MWISPQAEEDARAVRMQAQGRGLPAEALLQRYLPPVHALLWQLVHTTMQRIVLISIDRQKFTLCGKFQCVFLPQGSELPAALVLGQASCSVTISGSHVDPTIAGSWEAPAAQVPTQCTFVCTVH